MMFDKADIIRQGEAVFDPNTGLITTPETTVYAAHSVWLRMPTAVEAERLFGEEQVTTSRYIAVVSHDTTDVAIGDIVRFTEASDPDMLTRDYRVVMVQTGPIMAARKLGCETVEQ